MNYIFDTSIAEKYGLEEAIMIGNFQFWLNKNKANNYNFINGRYWTFNSIKSFESLFPFWTKKQITRILNSLIEKEILIKDNFNKSPYDRTCWYAFKDENKFLFVSENDRLKEEEKTNKKTNEKIEEETKEIAETETEKSIFPNGKMKEPKWENQNDQMGKYKVYTDINTDINTDNKKEINKEKSFSDNELDFVDEEYKDTFYRWLSYKKEKRKGYKTLDSKKTCYRKLLKLANNSPSIAKEIVEQSIGNNWDGLFVLKQNFKVNYEGGYKTSKTYENTGFTPEQMEEIRRFNGF